jgi:hypothetical protein
MFSQKLKRNHLWTERNQTKKKLIKINEQR